jgi:hypothetical protein
VAQRFASEAEKEQNDGGYWSLHGLQEILSLGLHRIRSINNNRILKANLKEFIFFCSVTRTPGNWTRIEKSMTEKKRSKS